MASCQGKYKTLRFRSLLELCYYQQLERAGLDLKQSVRPEPFRIPYKIGHGKSRDYIPDIGIYRLGLLIEIKPEARVKTRMNDAKFAAAHAFCKNIGMKFVVITEKQIEVKPLSQLAESLDIEWSQCTLKKRRFGKKIREARKRSK